MEGHQKCRQKLCYICGENAQGNHITNSLEGLVQKFVSGASNYSKDDIKTPNGEALSIVIELPIVTET